MLLDLCKGEGWTNMTEIKFNGKTIEVNAEFASSINELKAGTFEGTYVCAPEKVKMDLRQKLGTKYLSWA